MSEAAIQEHLSPEAGYDLAAVHYDDWSWQDFWREHEFPLVRRFLESRPSPRGDLLDVGCGTGYYLGRLRDLFERASGVDLSEGMLAVARSGHPALDLRKGGAESLPFPDASFEAVICCRVLTHVRDVDSAFAEIGRVLRPRGLAVVTNIDADHPYGSTRLPTADGSVFVETIKHTAPELVASAGRNGLLKRYCGFLGMYGDVVEMAARPSWDESIVSSFMVFDRGQPAL
ncbi:class I SAM-dependent methyltransferase [Rhizobium sp. BK176]|uniref:class I SAM-dependent methyltransferase n=1 Tax=Rhizobium sp. BK176 TaxID=2587071 RepID=UPI00216A3564|nr:class I SAM-dependent methyltransferase [Rhizobium sp. BK176]MCS4089068.1 ubiquinone/menaquinone biosynthesis C-methylase UbiE [Rhizobium sp. BK176]